MHRVQRKLGKEQDKDHNVDAAQNSTESSKLRILTSRMHIQLVFI